ncbi:Alpha/beta hydrolase fold-3 [Macleaya cordata]|uniref:Alpha/beta hydrolase fold-3 n=1 Tax=Macleaya cordata TaxID=56857 RepID=A0A200QAC1_MACCD|nr:Alpha/beta hydrolase fold-3 [Macleaya cordata]OVA07394.1 Alpha/beta hydrolase fold-3 [Macleaya cordata]
MSNTITNTPPYEVEEVRGVLRIYSDGSIVRSTKPSFDVPVHDDSSVLWKDVLFNTTHNLHLRLYKPASSSTTATKLPIFYYIHGGGFCIGSRAWPNCQNYCFLLASQLQAVIISPDYRLAPENRLPAAIEDGYLSVKWLQDQALSENPDTWLTDVADFGRVFISGDSAGGNIAHNLAVRFGAGSAELAPVRVRGYVLLAPFFGGTVRTRSEAEGPREAFLNLELIERFWRLSIPVGDTTDHPLVNPFGPESPSLEPMALDPILVVVGGSDLLKDRAEYYAKKLKAFGKKVEYVEFEGKQHGFFTIDPNSEASNKLMQKEMINTNTPYEVEEEVKGILRTYRDGLIVRSNPSFDVPIHDDGSVLWKDVLFNTTHNLHLRLYKPTSTTTNAATKLPIFYYIHGGGFCIGSRAWPKCQNSKLLFSSSFSASSRNYLTRLSTGPRESAPSCHGYLAVKWLQDQSQSENPDTWLTDVADFGRVFISGDSSGGNIAHHLAVRFSAGSAELAPLRIRGYVLLAPFFGGTVRTRSEEEEEAPREGRLKFWRLSIPVGDTTDHPLVNPFGPTSPSLEPVALDPILVVVGGSDILKDRAEYYAKKLKEFGKKVEYMEFEGKQHGFFTNDPYSEASSKLMQVIKQFIISAEN